MIRQLFVVVMAALPVMAYAGYLEFGLPSGALESVQIALQGTSAHPCDTENSHPCDSGFAHPCDTKGTHPCEVSLVLTHLDASHPCDTTGTHPCSMALAMDDRRDAHPCDTGNAHPCL